MTRFAQALRNIGLIIQAYPAVLANDVKVRFWGHDVCQTNLPAVLRHAPAPVAGFRIMSHTFRFLLAPRSSSASTTTPAVS